MARLQHLFDTLRARDERAMGLFLTNGFPDPESTLPVLRAVDAGGADFIELGMPFSDPLAEGLPIQRSSARALAHGVRMTDAFETAAAFRSESETPLLLMGYVNPLLRYGVERFCADAREAGVDGLILPDLPPEEASLVAGPARAHDLDLVMLVAPNTPEARVRRIDTAATGFVYAVSVTGLTGSAMHDTGSVEDYLARTRTVVSNPLLVGFGIRSHEDAMRLSTHTDGFIVGSALIQRVEALWDDQALSAKNRLHAVEAFARLMKHGGSSGEDTAVSHRAAGPTAGG